MAKNWFGIDSTGWRRMNAGRKMGHLIREGISNVFDLDDVTKVDVTVEPGHVIIEDDGFVGFEDPDLIFTVFMTGKEDSHLKRGRKGRGLKELIAAADKAVVETRGYTIRFDKDGRTQEDNSRTNGTKVEIWSSLETWQEEGVKDALAYLRRIIPPTKIWFTLNDKRVSPPKFKRAMRTFLQTTVIKDEVEKCLFQETAVTLYELRKRERTGWVYEMGIPVEESTTPFHVDISQRIPMNDNRDTINSYWVERMHAALVAEMISSMDKKDLRQRWVLECTYQLNSSVGMQYAVKMVGEKAAVKTGDRRADDLARQHGFEVVDLSILPGNVADVIRDYVKDTRKIAQEVCEARQDQVISPNAEQTKFLRIVQWFGKKLLDKTVLTRLFAREPDFTGFTTQAEYGNSTIGFNVLGGNDFSKPLAPENIATMVHEFAHDACPEEHNEMFQAEVERLSGKMGYVILHHYDEIREKFGRVSYMPGKTTVIQCVDCGADREIKVQDKFQVRKCVVCKDKERREKRRNRRA